MTYDERYDVFVSGSTPFPEAGAYPDGIIGAVDAQHVFALYKNGIYRREADFINHGSLITPQDAQLVFAHRGNGTAALTVDALVADMTAQHQINLPAPINYYASGTHPITNNVAQPSGSANITGWSSGMYDDTQWQAGKDAQVEMTPWKVYTLSRSTGRWTLRLVQVPTWTVHTNVGPDTFDYVDITGTATANGKKYQLPPPGRAHHFAVDLVSIDADVAGCHVRYLSRLLGTDKATAIFACSAGADWKTPGGAWNGQMGGGRQHRLRPDTDPDGGWECSTMTVSYLDPLMEECHGASYYPIQSQCEAEVTGYRNTTMAGIRSNPPPRWR